MIYCKKNLKAFTLIELLVVIAIIGILAALVLTSISSARARARDVQRKNDIGQIAKALEMYYGDNENYPVVYQQLVSGGQVNTYYYAFNRISSNTNAVRAWNDILKPAIEPNYIKQVPQDPINDSSHYYIYYADVKSTIPYATLGMMFSITASSLENANDPQRCEINKYLLFKHTITSTTYDRFCDYSSFQVPFNATRNQAYGTSSQQ